MIKILMIDNYDSFVYNLVDEFKKRGYDVEIYRNDVGMNRINQVILSTKPDLLVLSPGPSAPNEAGDLERIIETYHKNIPIFGVCLGHQAVGEVFGGRIVRAPEFLHGKTSSIYHNGRRLYSGLENPFDGGRYHSLAVTGLPDCLEETAYTFAKNDQRIIMGFRHKEYLIENVQFHPESILTVPHGSKIIDNMLKLVEIDKLRKGITELDKEIVRRMTRHYDYANYVEQRSSLAEQIGRRKIELNMEVVDSTREERVIAFVREEAVKVGISPDDVERVYKDEIIPIATERQKKLKIS